MEETEESKAVTLNRKIGDFERALAALESEWQKGTSPEPEHGMQMHTSHIAECRTAFYLKQHWIFRINQMFSQQALATRYCKSKRAIEEACEYFTHVKDDRRKSL